MPGVGKLSRTATLASAGVGEGRSTHKHEARGDVVRLHQWILVQPDLLWLDDSLERVQELGETAIEQRQAKMGAWLRPDLPRGAVSSLRWESSVIPTEMLDNSSTNRTCEMTCKGYKIWDSQSN